MTERGDPNSSCSVGVPPRTPLADTDQDQSFQRQRHMEVVGSHLLTAVAEEAVVPRDPQPLLNLSFTLHGRTTRATGGAMRESFPARSGVLPFAVTRIPCAGPSHQSFCPGNVAPASGLNRPQPF